MDPDAPASARRLPIATTMEDLDRQLREVQEENKLLHSQNARLSDMLDGTTEIGAEFLQQYHLDGLISKSHSGSDDGSRSHIIDDDTWATTQQLMYKLKIIRLRNYLTYQRQHHKNQFNQWAIDQADAEVHHGDCVCDANLGKNVGIADDKHMPSSAQQFWEYNFESLYGCSHEVVLEHADDLAFVYVTNCRATTMMSTRDPLHLKNKKLYDLIMHNVDRIQRIVTGEIIGDRHGLLQVSLHQEVERAFQALERMNQADRTGAKQQNNTAFDQINAGREIVLEMPLVERTGRPQLGKARQKQTTNRRDQDNNVNTDASSAPNASNNHQDTRATPKSSTKKSRKRRNADSQDNNVNTGASPVPPSVSSNSELTASTPTKSGGRGRGHGGEIRGRGRGGRVVPHSSSAHRTVYSMVRIRVCEGFHSRVRGVVSRFLRRPQQHATANNLSIGANEGAGDRHTQALDSSSRAEQSSSGSSGNEVRCSLKVTRFRKVKARFISAKDSAIRSMRSRRWLSGKARTRGGSGSDQEGLVLADLTTRCGQDGSEQLDDEALTASGGLVDDASELRTSESRYKHLADTP
jgi:hypothetical protein